MKFREIVSFELNYRKNRPATYIYFFILLAISVLALSSKAVTLFGAGQLVSANSPVLIAKMMSALSLVFVFITSAVMGVSVLRDFEHKIASLLYITPIRKWQYLLGRFTGSFITLLLIFLGIIIGMLFTEFIPTRHSATLLPFNFKTYLYPFLFIVLPNLLFTATLFFMAGALSRSMLFVYVQGIALFLIYTILDESVFEMMGNKTLAALLDPMALHTLLIESEYWSVAQQNQQMISLNSLLGLNRLIWLSITVVLWLVAFKKFKFELIGKKVVFLRKRASKKALKPTPAILTPVVQITQDGLLKNLRQILRQSFFYARMVLKETPFRVIMAGALVFLIIASLNIGGNYANVKTYPLTYMVLEAFGRLSIFFMTIIIFYAGELIWKERSTHFDVIYDALPTQTYVNLLGKMLGMIWVFVGVLGFLVLAGIIIQSSYQYYNHEVPLYLQVLSTQTLFFVIWYTVLAFFIQVIINHKFLAYIVTFLVFVTILLMDFIGLEHGLFKYGQASLGRYSDMNGFTPVSSGFVAYSVYWFSLAAMLIISAALLFVRGKETTFRYRLTIARQRFGRPLFFTGIASAVIFLCSGFYIYYNTQVLNDFQTKKAQDYKQVRYEKQLKQFEDVPQPKITDVTLKIDLYPAQRRYIAKGEYLLKNLNNQPVTEVHVQHNRMLDPQARLTNITFDKAATQTKDFKELPYTIYKLQQPLQPQEQIKMSFVTEFTTEGFVEKPSELYESVLANGTFMDNSHFPTLGYNPDLELDVASARKRYGLPAKQNTFDSNHPKAHQHGIMGDDAYKINLEVVLSTETDQIAIAPGYLQKQWKQGNRAYFHYKMDQPIENFYSIVSARYQVLRDSVMIQDGEKSKKVDLAIYYDAKHQYNLKSMMRSMKHSLQYCSKNFSPYQYRQLRIMEFPRYAGFAQAFANTVPFSEGIGFVLDQRQAIDIAYKVTAHEVGHQWWGHQVMAAHVHGAGMVLESLAQYSSVMVMKNHLPQEQLQKYMEFEHHRYFRGRTRLREKETPLSEASIDPNYLQYGKGAVNLFALQHYIGEDNVNRALRNFIRQTDSLSKEEITHYATTQELIACIRKQTPDSLQVFVTDLFEKIILFDNKATKAKATKQGNAYMVELTIDAQKFKVNDQGQEQKIKINDWVDVGIYGQTKDGKEKLLYLKKHKITTPVSKLRIKIKQRPIKAGIDPLNILMDKNVENNVIGLE
ncbi:hypothetical protein BKI52_24155 [marine bacterium AO1-C]|nr:hypothetical protein BKI52_24155 [marine bacterium AO1-C]